MGMAESRLNGESIQKVATVPATWYPLGYAQLSSLNVARGLPSIPAGARLALVMPEGQAVRWRDDGNTPTAAVGMPLALGQSLVVDVADLTAFKVIEQAASATLNVAYYA